MWKGFHLESNIVPANIKCLESATYGLRFELDNLLKDQDEEKMSFGAAALLIADFQEGENAVVGRVNGFDGDRGRCVWPSRFNLWAANHTSADDG